MFAGISAYRLRTDKGGRFGVSGVYLVSLYACLASLGAVSAGVPAQHGPTPAGQGTGWRILATDDPKHNASSLPANRGYSPEGPGPKMRVCGLMMAHGLWNFDVQVTAVDSAGYKILGWARVDGPELMRTGRAPDEPGGGMPNTECGHSGEPHDGTPPDVAHAAGDKAFTPEQLLTGGGQGLLGLGQGSFGGNAGRARPRPSRKVLPANGRTEVGDGAPGREGAGPEGIDQLDLLRQLNTTTKKGGRTKRTCCGRSFKGNAAMSSSAHPARVFSAHGTVHSG